MCRLYVLTYLVSSFILKIQLTFKGIELLLTFLNILHETEQRQSDSFQNTVRSACQSIRNHWQSMDCSCQTCSHIQAGQPGPSTLLNRLSSEFRTSTVYMRDNNNHTLLAANRPNDATHLIIQLIYNLNEDNPFSSFYNSPSSITRIFCNMFEANFIYDTATYFLRYGTETVTNTSTGVYEYTWRDTDEPEPEISDRTRSREELYNSVASAREELNSSLRIYPTVDFIQEQEELMEESEYFSTNSSDHDNNDNAYDDDGSDEDDDGGNDKEVNQTENAMILCKICYKQTPLRCLNPCGHLLCSTCMQRVIKCPFCRKSIKRTYPCFP